MAMNDDGRYVYETEPLGMGDPLRVALSHLQRNLEAFLFDSNDPGYGNPDFLSWALEHSKVTASSSGTLSNMQYRWDPKFYENQDPSVESETDNDNAGRFYDGSIRFAKPGFSTDASAPEAIDFEGEVVVTRPEYARLVNSEPRVVTEYAALDHDSDADAEGMTSPGVPYPADPSKEDPTQAQENTVAPGPNDEHPDEAPLGHDPVTDTDPEYTEQHEDYNDRVIETPADSYEPVEDDEDGEK